MIRVEATHTFAGGLAEAFAYITDLRHWPQYWPDFVRIEDAEHAHWGRVGDRVTIVLKLLNRERALDMTLQEFRKDERVAYVSRQAGLPDVRHERHFKPVPGGFEYRLVVTYDPRPGLAGLFDRLLLKRAIARAMDKTIRNLQQVLGAAASPGAAAR
jgi:hypothetical protein